MSSSPSSSISSSSSLQVQAPHSPSRQTNEHNDGHATIIDVHLTPHMDTPAASTSVIARPARCLTTTETTEESALLTPEQEHEQEQQHEIKQRVLHFTLTTSALLGSCTGIGWCANGLRHSLSIARPIFPTIPHDATVFDLERLLHLDTPPSNEETSSLRESFDIYLLTLFCLIALFSLSLTLLTTGRLALALHLRNRSKLDAEKQGQESPFWSLVTRVFGDQSMQFQKLQLPTYVHAVKQSVLKTGRRPGVEGAEFHNISAEEMELERIQKLGGAPPAYVCQS